jgi:hypothetical protein
MSNVPLHFNHVEEVSPSLIQLTMDESQANYLLASLTAEEREGITSSVTPEGVQLTLPPSFSWDPAVQQAAPSLYTYRFISGQKGSKIQLKYNAKKKSVEVSVL